MTEEKKKIILESAQVFMRERIISKHIQNTRKLRRLKEFNVNPFLEHYLPQFAFGEDSSYNLARVLIYARALGTSITTSFGSNMQHFVNEVLFSFPSTTQGMDIEFNDEIDHIHKYCQLTAGPKCINKGGGEAIQSAFRDTINLARQNRARVAPCDCVVGILYGTRAELNSFYRKLEEDYTVYVGQEFWYHLTGDPGFYNDLIQAFNEVSAEVDYSTVLNETIIGLAEEIEALRNQN